MKLEILGRNYNVSDDLKKITEKKSQKLARRLKKDDEATVKYTVTLENDEYLTDLIVTSHGQTYRAEAKSATPYDNLDIVIPRVLGQFRKQKDIWGKSKKGAPNNYPED